MRDDLVALRRGWERLAGTPGGVGPLPSLDPGLVAANDGAAQERLCDALRPEVVRALRAGAPGDFRLTAVPCLDRAARDPDSETRTRFRQALAGRAPFAQRVVRARDPAERSDACAEWNSAMRQVESCLAARLRAAERASGSPCVAQWLRVGLPDDGEEWLGARAERHWIAPLDAKVAERRVERLARATLRLGEIGSEAEDVALRALLDHPREVLDVTTWCRLAQRTAAALGHDPDGKGPAVKLGGADPAGTRVELFASPRPTLELGSDLGGPGCGGAVLGSVGVVVRAHWVRRRHGEVALAAGDPVATRACEALFGRLPASAGWREWGRLNGGESWAGDARFELAVGCRRAWALARSWLRDARDRAIEDYRRATGRAAPPDLAIRLARWDHDPLDDLRGASYAILLEERLLSRWGHAWFTERAAGKWLGEVWDAESLEGVPAVVNSWSLGTMDTAPLIEGYRP